jgi:hypothetical protein
VGQNHPRIEPFTTSLGLGLLVLDVLEGGGWPLGWAGIGGVNPPKDSLFALSLYAIEGGILMMQLTSKPKR